MYAVWGQNTTKTWSITYNANGGYNTPAKQTANVGQPITITYSKPTRSGYTFLGWGTWLGATEPESAYTPGYSYTSDSDTTLYAVWRQNQTTQYSLSFDLQGGTGTFNTLYGGYGERVQIPYTLQQKADTHLKAWRLIPAVIYRISQENIILYMETALFMPFGKVQAVQRSTILILIYRVDLERSILYMEYTGEKLFIPSSSPTKDGYRFQDGLTS